ncbi:MAG: acyltransferase [Massilia sp.]
MQWLSQQFELSRSGSAANVRPMEGLRGFAVFLVFLVHYVTLIDPWLPAASPLGVSLTALRTIGNAGVDLFFVLSGYLIYGSLMARPQAFAAFMRRRVVRIYPAFLVVFVLYVLLSVLRPAESKIPAGSAAAAVYLLENLALLPGLLPIEPLITVAWSLSYEMFYYLVMPPLIGMLSLRARTSRWRVAFFIALAGIIVLLCSIYEGPIRLIMFIAGILLYEALPRHAGAAPRSGFAFAALLAGLWSSALPFFGAGALAVKMLILFGTFFIVCFCCFSRPRSALARGFSWAPLRWLGNMSYSYYLLHGLALKAGFLLLAKAAPATPNGALVLAMLPLMFLLTLLVSGVLFLLVERPFSLAPAGRPATLPATPEKVSA